MLLMICPTYGGGYSYIGKILHFGIARSSTGYGFYLNSNVHGMGIHRENNKEYLYNEIQGFVQYENKYYLNDRSS